MRLETLIRSAFFQAAIVVATGVLLAALVEAAGGATGQLRPHSTGIRFKLQAHDPPNQAQPKLMLEAASGETLQGALILLTEAKLKTYATNGTLERLAEAPECVFDSTRRTVSSAGPLRMHTADGKARLDGLGFWLQLTNSSFIISNQVRIQMVIQNKSGSSLFR